MARWAAPMRLALRDIRQIVAQCAPLSAALGEFTDPPDEETFTALAGYQFAKIGLAGAMDAPDWESRRRELVEQLPRGTSPVAVIYADWQRCRAPSPAVVLAAVRELRCAEAGGPPASTSALRCPIVLLDTFIKDGRNLLASLSLQQLEQLIEQVHNHEMRIVLAGGIDADVLDDIATLRPDFIGVRGAVCRGRRDGPLDERLVRELAQRLHT